MRERVVQCRSARLLLGAVMVAGVVLAGAFIGGVEVQATTIYSYIDEQGNPRFSDTLDHIPDKYRAKVKTHEQASSPERFPSAFDSVRGMVSPPAVASLKQKAMEFLNGIGITLPSGAGTSAAAPSSDMRASQSQILNYAGAAAVVLLLMMYVSKSQLMRLLGLCLLIMLGVATPLLMYVSDDGSMTSMKGKVTAAGQAQQDRVKQIVP